jgi:hypothetical protein
MNCNCETRCHPCNCGGAIEGESRRDAAINLQATHHESQMIQIQRRFLTELLEGGDSTTDSVSDSTPLAYRRSCLGAATNHLAKAGLIEFVRFTKSTRPDRHSNPTRVWRLTDRDAAIRWLADHPAPNDPDGAKGSQGVLFSLTQETATTAAVLQSQRGLF